MLVVSCLMSRTVLVVTLVLVPWGSFYSDLRCCDPAIVLGGFGCFGRTLDLSKAKVDETNGPGRASLCRGSSRDAKP